jgi:hypothetical protein
MRSLIWRTCVAAIACFTALGGARAEPMWAAIQDEGTLVFEYFPTGPSGTTTAAHLLQIGQTLVNPANFRGFQFVSASPNPGGVVPEPATWALLIVGFGLVGASLRHRRASVAEGRVPDEQSPIGQHC